MVDPEIEEIARLGACKYHNASRALHRYVHRSGKTLSIPLETVPLRVRRMKKTGGETTMQWPVLRLSTWIRTLMESGGAEFLLAGHAIDEEAEYRSTFSRFWERYQNVDPKHAVYAEKTAEERSLTLPVAVHGDEGRGLGKAPVLVETFQPLISFLGESVQNSLGCRVESVCSESCPIPSIISFMGSAALNSKASVHDSPSLHTLAFYLLRLQRPVSGRAS